MKVFRKMGAIKPAIVLQFFERFNLSTIVLSDTDTVWLRDPVGMLYSSLAYCKAPRFFLNQHHTSFRLCMLRWRQDKFSTSWTLQDSSKMNQMLICSSLPIVYRMRQVFPQAPDSSYLR